MVASVSRIDNKLSKDSRVEGVSVFEIGKVQVVQRVVQPAASC